MATCSFFVLDLFIEVILQFTNLLLTYLLSCLLILEIQKRFLNTQVQALTFQNNMKLYSPPAYTLYTASLVIVSILNHCTYCFYLHTFLVDAFA